ncbi:MAG: helix-turn-helix domain-containing protein [Lachnospiraceae bacterium]|nr:helix-turn-helix domain-containing protein [Lachnospiraceae bacterium]
MSTLQITLAAARVNAGMTQSDVAQKLHISKTTVVNWEKGKVSPSFADIQAISALYNIPMDNIFLPIQST